MLYFQTSNTHKFNEAKEILAGHGIKIKRIATAYEEIQALSLEEVALSALSKISMEGVFIEDAGLFIDSLKRFPGVYSSYVLGTLGLRGVLKLMEGVADRKAKFVSIVGIKHAGRVKLFKGVVRGTISLKPRGNAGFGYDPIFIPQGYEKTFAEDILVKKNISHRRRALEKLARYVKRRI